MKPLLLDFLLLHQHLQVLLLDAPSLLLLQLDVIEVLEHLVRDDHLLIDVHEQLASDGQALTQHPIHVLEESLLIWVLPQYTYRLLTSFGPHGGDQRFTDFPPRLQSQIDLME